MAYLIMPLLSARSVVLVGTLMGLVRMGAETPKGRDAAKLYSEFCANCHGANLEGGKGGSLVPLGSKHGADEPSLARSIREGFPTSGMPGFAQAITDVETTALVAFLRETATRQVDPQPTTDLPIPRGPQRSEEHGYYLETIAEGLDVPWSIAFLPDGRMLVTERAGRLRIIEQGRLQAEPVGGIPDVEVKEEAGLMSVVAHPDFARDPWIYLSFSEAGTSGTSGLKIIRGRLHDGRLVDQQTVFAQPRERHLPGFVLYGGRLVFDGPYLFFSVGVRGLEPSIAAHAQDLTLPNGKIHRVYHDGSIPPDNPFVAMPGAVPSIWSYGVRNPQGLARHPRDGSLWETEHGPRGGDELNRIVAGRNYGWPVVTFGMNYDGTPITRKTEAPGMERPIVDWTPSIAASQLEFYTGDLFPRWKHQLFVGSLATQKLLRLVLDGDRVTHTEEIFKNFGRVRDIKTGPDGCLYIALELIGKPGRIVRLTPSRPTYPTAAGD
jgi:glucose/arabinose dehydrogenase